MLRVESGEQREPGVGGEVLVGRVAVVAERALDGLGGVEGLMATHGRRALVEGTLLEGDGLRVGHRDERSCSAKPGPSSWMDCPIWQG